MTKKKQCKALMCKFFGPASAELVEFMKEDEVVEKCRKKVAVLLGEEKASAFNHIS